MREFGSWNRQENLDFWRDDHTCSFCGSYDPELFLEKLLHGEVSISPTDKNYKIYIKGLESFAKFYFQHFTIEQQNEFIRIYNIKPKPFKVEYPGYLYVLPFFAAPKKGDE